MELFENIIEKDVELIKENKLNYYMVYLNAFATDFLIDTTNNSIDLDRVNMFKIACDKVFESLKNEYKLIERIIIKENDLYKQKLYKIEL